MSRVKAGSTLVGVAAALLIGTAALHHTGFRSARDLGARAGGDLAIVVPALWLFFSVSLVSVGLASAAMAWRPVPGHRLVLVCLALVPAGGAALQIAYVGFVPPTLILLVDAAALLSAALVLPPRVKAPAA